MRAASGAGNATQPAAQARTAGHRPNQLWCWDITKLHGPAKWTYFYLYVILDVFSRYVVGWMVAHARAPPWRRSSSRRPAPSRASRPGN